MRSTKVGTMKQRISSLGWMGAFLSVVGGASAFACSGEEFCAESRTCPGGDDANAAGHAGQGSDGLGGTDSGTAGSANEQGGHDSTSVVGAGAGGEPTSTVGNTCTTDAECDDKSSCTGVEKCVDGACAAGEAVPCPAGLTCSDAKNDACVFKGNAPWILYAVDAETKGVNELYGVKSDLVGTMQPVKLSPALAAGWAVADGAPIWSPDGTAAVINTTNQQLKKVDSYLLRFGERLPEKAILLTEGMSASTVSTAQWSASGNSLVLQRDDGVHWLRVAEDGKVTQELASGTYIASPAWIKNDSEVVFYGKNIVPSKLGFYLAERGASSWSQKLIAEVPSTNFATLTPDGSLLGYLIVDMVSFAQTLWVVETTAGAKPAKIAGPAASMIFTSAPDGSQFLLAVTNGGTGKTAVNGGARADLFALPALKTGLSLVVNDIFPLFPATPWAPDSSRAWGFQDDPIGKQLAIFQPKQDEKWHPLSLKQLKTDPYPVWSPDSSVLALPTKTAADSPIGLTLISSAAYESRDLDQTVNGGFIKMLGFSAGSEFFAYAKGTGGPATNGFYIDLRQGLAKAPAPLPIQDPIQGLQFASHGTGALYARAGKNDCFYIDFASATPDTASAVNEGKPVASCSFQKLPK